MPCSREKYSKTRSRPRQDCAYSPTGSGGSSSVAPADVRAAPARRRCRWRRRPRARPGEAAGHQRRHDAFWAQVRSGRSAEPNLRPARNSTLRDVGESLRPGRDRAGRRAAPRSPSRCEAVGERRLGEAGRRRTRGVATPAAYEARRTRRASEGPILPPAPRTRTSSVRVRAKATSAAKGAKAAPRAALRPRWCRGSCGPRGRGQGSRLDKKWRVAPAQGRGGGGATRRPGRLRTWPVSPIRKTLPGEKPSTLLMLSRPQHGGGAVVRVAVDEVRVQLPTKPLAVAGEELRVVEGVVEQGRELQAEAVSR